MAWLSAALLLAALALPAGRGVPLPPTRPAAIPLPPARPGIAAPPAVAVETEHGPPTGCDRRLAAMAVFEPKPTLSGPGACGGPDLVALKAVLMPAGGRVAVEPAATLRCGMAESFAAWLRDEVAPRLKAFNSPLRAVETADGYDCRSRNGIAGAKVSEHGKGNAVDVRAFVLADRREIVLTDTAEPAALRVALRDGACGRFTTVLGPGADAYHTQHVHLDGLVRTAGYRICQWDVREPAVVAGAGGVPLPPPRPPVPKSRKL